MGVNSPHDPANIVARVLEVTSVWVDISWQLLGTWALPQLCMVFVTSPSAPESGGLGSLHPWPLVWQPPVWLLHHVPGWPVVPPDPLLPKNQCIEPWDGRQKSLPFPPNQRQPSQKAIVQNPPSFQKHLRATELAKCLWTGPRNAQSQMEGAHSDSHSTRWVGGSREHHWLRRNRFSQGPEDAQVKQTGPLAWQTH